MEFGSVQRLQCSQQTHHFCWNYPKKGNKRILRAGVLLFVLLGEEDARNHCNRPADNNKNCLAKPEIGTWILVLTLTGQIPHPKIAEKKYEEGRLGGRGCFLED